MTNTYRTTTAVIALTVAALATPTLAHAKRMGGSKSRSIPPASIGKAPSTPAAPVAPKAPAAPAAAAAPAPAPTAAAAPAARGPGMMGTMGAAAEIGRAHV